MKLNPLLLAQLIKSCELSTRQTNEAILSLVPIVIKEMLGILSCKENSSSSSKKKEPVCAQLTQAEWLESTLKDNGNS